ncbi:MAG: hypothetical protein H7256_02735 [Bdellovibrio sp.]|nr:hypothetical protein [Bdellovibrio sp.]
MTKLIAYTQYQLQSFSLKADLKNQSSKQWVLTFQIENKDAEVDFQSTTIQANAAQVPRKDELWKNICFEFFLNPVGQKKYYEFNFGLNPAWNCYLFDGYRMPQPPKASAEFEILDFIWNGSELKVTVENRSSYTSFNVGITAIIKDIKNQTHYFALKHAGEKPDFHLQDSFILQRGS